MVCETCDYQVCSRYDIIKTEGKKRKEGREWRDLWREREKSPYCLRIVSMKCKKFVLMLIKNIRQFSNFSEKSTICVHVSELTIHSQESVQLYKPGK